jgi:hypothetical protein
MQVLAELDSCSDESTRGRFAAHGQSTFNQRAAGDSGGSRKHSMRLALWLFYRKRVRLLYAHCRTGALISAILHARVRGAAAR